MWTGDSTPLEFGWGLLWPMLSDMRVRISGESAIMSQDDFDALVTLIKAIVRAQIELAAHPHDRPRCNRIMLDMEEAEDEAAAVLVL